MTLGEKTKEVITNYPERIFFLSDLKEFTGEVLTMTAIGGREEMAFYRGQSLNTNKYKLRPNIGRHELTEKQLVEIEPKLLQELEKSGEARLLYLQNHPHLKKYPYANEWFKLMQGQHLGLETRLMDWTDDDEVALLFAVDNEKYHDVDGQLWCLFCSRENRVNSDGEEELLQNSPIETKDYKLINFPYYADNDYTEDDIPGERRRIRQKGKFLIQSAASTILPMEENPEFRNRLIKMIVDGQSKKKIKKELNDLGLTIDWAYYRKADNIDAEIKRINKLYIGA